MHIKDPLRFTFRKWKGLRNYLIQLHIFTDKQILEGSVSQYAVCCCLFPAVLSAKGKGSTPLGGWRCKVGKQAYSELTVDSARSSLALGRLNEATLNQTPYGAPVIQTNLLNEALR